MKWTRKTPKPGSRPWGTLGAQRGSLRRQRLCVVTGTRAPALSELSSMVWKAALTLGFNKTTGYSNALESQSHGSGNDSHSLVMKNSPPHAAWDGGATKQTVNRRERALSWHFLSPPSEIPSYRTRSTWSEVPLIRRQNPCRCNNCASQICLSDLKGQGGGGGWEPRLRGFPPTYCMHYIRRGSRERHSTRAISEN